MARRKTPPRKSPAPVVHEQPETDQDDAQAHDRPQGDQLSRPSAHDTRVNDGGREESEANVETGLSEEDARNRRDDLF